MAVALSERYAAVAYSGKPTIEAWDLETGVLVYAGAIQDNPYLYDLVIRGSTVEAVSVDHEQVHLYSADLERPGPLVETVLPVPGFIDWYEISVGVALSEAGVAVIGQDEMEEEYQLWLIHRETGQVRSFAAEQPLL